MDRVAYSPGEFAALFGKHQTWGYRQIYAGKVTAITEHGRILIPAVEVERILGKAGIYSGEKKRKAAQATNAELWQKFVSRQKTDGTRKAKRSHALARLVTARGS